MNNLNQIVTPEVVATSKLEQVCKAKDQINREGINTCYLDIFDSHVTVTIDQPDQHTIINEYQFTVEEMKQAVAFIKQFVTVSPVSSAKEGALLEMSA